MIEILQTKGNATVPIIVVSDFQDPKFIQNCISTGIADFVLYPEKPADILPRLGKVIEQSSGIGAVLVRVATSFLGPAAGVFLERQAKDKMNVAKLEALQRDHLPEFLHYLTITVQPILTEKVVQFIRRLEHVFGVERQS